MLGIAAHKLADAQRRGHVERRAQRRLGIPAIEWTDEDLARVIALGDGQPVAALLEQLPGDQRAAVRARVIEERSYQDVASRLGVSAGRHPPLQHRRGHPTSPTTPAAP